MGKMEPGRMSGSGEKVITRRELPPPGTNRWVARRKAVIVAAVEQNVLTLEDACRIYDLSAEEFGSWRDAMEEHGLNALRSTALKRYTYTYGCMNW